VNTFMDGKTRYFDMTDPFNPKQVYEKTIGRQVNMASSSWDGSRIYYTSSLLANWDKKGEDNEQYFKAFSWDGKDLIQDFSIDFTEQKLGRAHQMRFGAYSLYSRYSKNMSPVQEDSSIASLAGTVLK
jgi:selenium-binding protein 1